MLGSLHPGYSRNASLVSSIQQSQQSAKNGQNSFLRKQKYEAFEFFFIYQIVGDMNFGKTFLKEVAEDPVYPILRLVSGKKMVLRCMKIFVGGGGIMATLGANGLGSPMGDFGEFGKLLWLCVCVSRRQGST